jgi:hypothetical protein
VVLSDDASCSMTSRVSQYWRDVTNWARQCDAGGEGAHIPDGRVEAKCSLGSFVGKRPEPEVLGMEMEKEEHVSFYESHFFPPPGAVQESCP